MRASAVALVLATASLAGCLDALQDLRIPGLGEKAPEIGELTFSTPVRIDESQPAREPAIAVAPDGAMYVAGFWGQYRYQEARPGSPQNVLSTPLIWKSDDGGDTWTRINPGLPIQGARGNSDIDIAVAPDGTVYVASLTYIQGFGTSLALGASGDGGASWTWQDIGSFPDIGRPWMRAAPDSSAHVVWGEPDGVHHAASTDGGTSWTQTRTAYHAGSAGGFDVGPQGELAVRVVPLSATGDSLAQGADGVSVSTDGGQSWLFWSRPGTRGWADPAGGEGDDTPRAFDPVAWDANATLYALWVEDTRLVIARSRTLGESWNMTQLIDEGKGKVLYYPFMRAGPRIGELGASWFTRDAAGTVADRVAHVLWSEDEERPRVSVGSFAADSGGDDHAEFYQLVFVGEGQIAAPVPMTDAGQWLDFTVARVE